MKFHTTVTVRTEWDAQALQTFDLGEVSPVQLAWFLRKYADDETLVVQVQLWNQRKVKRLMDRE